MKANVIVLTAVLAGACGRTAPLGGLEILAVTTTAATVRPGMTIDVWVLVQNNTQAPLALVRAELSASPAVEALVIAEVPAAQATLPAQSSASVRFAVTLPLTDVDTVLDATVVAADEAAGRLLRAEGAGAPLVLRTGSGTVTTDLLVSTVADDLPAPGLQEVAAAGPTLSLREAVAIADARGTPQVITFDPAVFPPSAPAVIGITGAGGTIALTAQATVIDASERGVVLSPAGGWDDTLLRIDGAHGAGVVALTFQDTQSALAIIDAGNVTVAACRFTGTPADIDRHGVHAVRAPGLQLVTSRFTWDLGGSHLWSVVVEESSRVVIAGNSFTAQPAIAVGAVDDSEVRDNAITGVYYAIELDLAARNRVARNQITQSTGTCLVLTGQSSDNLVEDNLFGDCGSSGTQGDISAIEVHAGSHRNALRRNVIFGSHGTIDIDSSAQEGVQPPVVAGVDDTAVHGNAAGPDGSVVEVYLDPAAWAEVYVGAAVVAAGAWRLELASPLPSGDNVTATVTLPSGSTSELADRLAVP